MNAPAKITSALSAIQALWPNQNENPFDNSGAQYDGKLFYAHAYNWNDDDQPWNFHWRDVEIKWYKYLGRGMEINRQMPDYEIAEMLKECLGEIFPQGRK